MADDDRRTREFYRHVLADVGHDVVGCAADGFELIAACLDQQPDLVVTDIDMPGLTGIEVAQRVSRHVAVPFLFVSAAADGLRENEAPRALSCGCLVKPIDQQALTAAIPVAMRRFRQRKRRRR